MKKLAGLLLLLVAACGDGTGTPTNNASDREAAAPNRASTANEARAMTASQAEAPAAPAPSILTATGIEPGLAFGMKRAEAVAIATAAFGAPTGKEHNDECGEGPMDFDTFRDLQLGFQDGKLVGWSLGGPRPALRARTGLAIGAPRSVLGDAEIDRDSSLGPEFDLEGIGGLLDEKEEKVEVLWAGFPCQFR